MKMTRIVISLSLLVLAGCATKQYPQAPSVTNEEAAAFDCKEIGQEIAKAHSVQNQIKETGSFDGRTVMGFIGDFGLGNGLAKSAANDKADARIMQLQNLKTARNCQ
jgi:outer membrane lipoprotein SlyB